MQDTPSEFNFWTRYWGKLSHASAGASRFEIFGLENISEPTRSEFKFSPEPSTVWGFLSSGSASVHGQSRHWEVQSGQWFCICDESLGVRLGAESRLFAMQELGYRGLNSMGGPVEEAGRLQYIDGCTDTLLCAPPILGEPCLNLLHFPQGVDQLIHHHPSFRTGIIVSGNGICVAAGPDLKNGNNFDLTAGTIFYLPLNTKHKFQTASQAMRVLTFHPDSDWGPTHEAHPMINRTHFNLIS